ncbi:MAG: 4Fe-4S binding protein [Bacillota bacterium]
MTKGQAFDGVASWEELEASPGYPPGGKVPGRRVAVIECVQEIPCNPCETACKQGAITVGTPITSLPSLDVDKCTGCGLCVAKCPGLAIFVVDLTGEDGKGAVVEFPYEYQPLPEVGEGVFVVNRQGEVIGEGIVKKSVRPKAYDKTGVVGVEVSPSLAAEARSIKRR